MVYSCIDGKNDELIKDVAELHFLSGHKILDLTWGKGNFWNLVDLSPYTFYKCDIAYNGIDFRNTPFKDGFFDVVVLDPPYAIKMGKSISKYNESYGLSQIENIQQIYDLYIKGILEARRIIRKGGILLIKCQDVTHGGSNYWVHDDIKAFCNIINLVPIDLFVLKNSVRSKPYVQKGSRKNHSYLWVMKKKKW